MPQLPGKGQSQFIRSHRIPGTRKPSGREATMDGTRRESHEEKETGSSGLRGVGEECVSFIASQ